MSEQLLVLRVQVLLVTWQQLAIRSRTFYKTPVLVSPGNFGNLLLGGIEALI